MQKRSVHILSVLSALLFVVLVLAPPSFAFDARSGDQIMIPAGDVIDDDLYLAGQTITVDGTVRGDVVAAGQTITINGTVEGGLIAAGQTVIVNGAVRDTARVAAQAVQVGPSASVGRDLVVFAYSLENRAGSMVGRDVGMAGYQALIAGPISRNLKAGLVGLELRSTVGGDVDVSVGSNQNATGATRGAPPPAVPIPTVSPGLTLTDTAQVDGHLSYTASSEFPIRGQVFQGVTWNARPVEEAPAPADWRTVLADNIRRLVALAAVGLLLIWLAPRWIRRLADTMQARPLPSIGWGFVTAIAAVGVALGIIFGTILLAVGFGILTLPALSGLVVALGLLAEGSLLVSLGVFLGFVAAAVVSYLAGRWLLERVHPAWATQPIPALLVGLVIFVVLTAIPVLGGIIGLLAAVAALGAMWIAVRDRREAAPVAQPAEPRLPTAA